MGIIVHIDLADFYVSGSPEHLATWSARLVPVKFRRVLIRVVKFVRSQQFIRARLLPDQLWKVGSGSGMGLRLSSFVANALPSFEPECLGSWSCVAGSQSQRRLRRQKIDLRYVTGVKQITCFLGFLGLWASLASWLMRLMTLMGLCGFLAYWGYWLTVAG